MKLMFGLLGFACSFSLMTQATSVLFMAFCFFIAAMFATMIDSAINDKFKKWGKS